MEKIVRVGADPFPPYQYRAGDGSIRGLDCDKVADTLRRAGFRPQVALYDWSEVERLFDAGALDAIFQIQPTPERLAKYHFSRLLREAATEVVTAREGLTLERYAQIPEKGLTLGVLEGYTNGPEIDRLDPACKKTYPNAGELLRAIGRQEVDLGVYDRGVKAYLMEQTGVGNVRAIETMTFTRPLHVAFRDPALRDAFDAALEEPVKI